MLGLKRQKNQRSNCRHSLDHGESKGIPEKISISASLTMLKPLNVWITTNCGKLLKKWEYQTQLTCLLRSLCASQETAVRTLYGTTDGFKTGKGIQQSCILSPYLFNLYAKNMVWNAALDESQAGIKIARRNVNNLSYTDDTTLVAENEAKLKSLLRVKEESEIAGLKLSIKRTKIMASGSTTSWQIEGENVETVTDFIFLGSKITVDGNCSQRIKRRLLFGRKTITNLDSVLKGKVITLPINVCIVKTMTIVFQ